jgi:hypothetical protein
MITAAIQRDRGKTVIGYSPNKADFRRDGLLCMHDHQLLIFVLEAGWSRNIKSLFEDLTSIKLL